jgi:hypothetical protein
VSVVFCPCAQRLHNYYKRERHQNRTDRESVTKVRGFVQCHHQSTCPLDSDRQTTACAPTLVSALLSSHRPPRSPKSWRRECLRRISTHTQNTASPEGPLLSARGTRGTPPGQERNRASEVAGRGANAIRATCEARESACTHPFVVRAPRGVDHSVDSILSHHRADDDGAHVRGGALHHEIVHHVAQRHALRTERRDRRNLAHEAGHLGPAEAAAAGHA